MMKKATHVYVTYIAAPLEKVWDAITDGEITKAYWGHRNVSDWKTGSKWEHQRTDETRTVDVAGTVIESSRPDRLVISWAFPDETDKPGAVSRVTFDLAKYAGGNTRLTVTHEDLEPGSEMEQAVSSGWHLVLSNLKSFVETGKAMPFVCRRD